MDKELVFFVDVDNTLLDNDYIKEEIRRSLKAVLGEEEAEYFWKLNNYFRELEKLVDFPNVIRAYCEEKHKASCDIKLGQIFYTLNFRSALYPKSLEVIAHLKTLGQVMLFTEGDSVYQKMKVEKSGLGEVVDGVLLLPHKLEYITKLKEDYEGRHLVFIEDRADLLLRIKAQLPQAFFIEVCQGHYAAADHQAHPALDKTVDSIGDLLTLKKEDILNQV